MRTGIAYLCVVFIWSTTPLGIAWSNDSFSFIAAVTLRVLIAGIASAIIMLVCRQTLVKSANDLRVYAVSSLGLFPSLFLVYWATQHIPTGLVAIILGVYPFAVGLFSQWILNDSILNKEKVIALCVALLGLSAINVDQLSLSDQAALGVLAVAVAAIIWAFSTVFVKKHAPNFHPFRLGTGTLMVAAPVFLALWGYLDGEIPHHVSQQSVWGVAYLVCAGSLIGHTLFYYVLKRCAVSSVSLIPLITPIIALALGYLLEGESVNAVSMMGAALILFSLLIYQGIVRRLIVRTGQFFIS